MGRKQKSKDQLPDERTGPRAGSRPGRRASDSSGPGRRGRRASDSSGPGRRAPDGSGRRPRRARRLAFLLALAGAATYLVRRNQRKAELDEGIWHEAPAPAPSAPASTA
jgi:hypothetical protein